MEYEILLAVLDTTDTTRNESISIRIDDKNVVFIYNEILEATLLERWKGTVNLDILGRID